MQSVINVRIDQEKILKEQYRRAAVLRSGYSFVVLELLSEHTKLRISGVDDILARSTEKKGKYLFEVVQRQLCFEEDVNRGGAVTAYILVTDHNLRMLASHFDNRYWEIVDVVSGSKNRITISEVLEKVEALRSTMIEEAVSTDLPQLQGKIKGMDVAELSDEILEQELARRKNKEADDDLDSVVEQTLLEEKTPEKIELTADISDEDYAKLTRGQKSYVSRLRRLEEKKEEDSMPDSPILSPAGMVQP